MSERTIDNVPSCGQENDCSKASDLRAMPSSLNDACRKMEIAADEIESLRAQLAAAEADLKRARGDLDRIDAALRSLTEGVETRQVACRYLIKNTYPWVYSETVPSFETFTVELLYTFSQGDGK